MDCQELQQLVTMLRKVALTSMRQYESVGLTWCDNVSLLISVTRATDAIANVQ